MIYPVITLHQPWATWIMRGWKPIETRTHDRFKLLKGKTVLIHAGLTTDESAANNPFLTKDQILQNPGEVVNGFILGSAFVERVDWLKEWHSKLALIDCGSVKRFGLFLNNARPLLEPIEEKGEQGIWYYDLEKKQKVKKAETNTNLKLF